MFERSGFKTVRPAKINTPAIALTQLAIVSVQDDYLVCNPVEASGNIDTETTVYVIKPWTLQRSPFDGQTVDGITYTYSSDIERVAKQGSTTETQQITPDYFAGAIIYAFDSGFDQALSDHVHAAILIDVNVDGRAWAVPS